MARLFGLWIEVFVQNRAAWPVKCGKKLPKRQFEHFKINFVSGELRGYQFTKKFSGGIDPIPADYMLSNTGPSIQLLGLTMTGDVASCKGDKGGSAKLLQRVARKKAEIWPQKAYGLGISGLKKLFLRVVPSGIVQSVFNLALATTEVCEVTRFTDLGPCRCPPPADPSRRLTQMQELKCHFQKSRKAVGNGDDEEGEFIVSIQTTSLFGLCPEFHKSSGVVDQEETKSHERFLNWEPELSRQEETSSRQASLVKRGRVREITEQSLISCRRFDGTPMYSGWKHGRTRRRFRTYGSPESKRRINPMDTAYLADRFPTAIAAHPISPFLRRAPGSQSGC
ncbi:hypothetical protein B0H11DRAFT_1904461 [Mycena galericulata]|nr:hypothetical protein B0H11DRAFT_1904461 [Mycena galericulata]